MVIRLSDSELAAVFAAARPLDVHCHSAFLQSAADILARRAARGAAGVARYR
jgi:hypothetical protein